MRTLYGLLPFLLSLTASVCTNAWGQSRPPSPGGITFERITTAEGLSAGTVRNVVQDQQGFLWIATGDGLNPIGAIYVYSERDLGRMSPQLHPLSPQCYHHPVALPDLVPVNDTPNLIRASHVCFSF